MRNVDPSLGHDQPFGNQESEDDNPPSGKRTKRHKRFKKSSGPEKVDEDGIFHDEDKNAKSTKPRASKGKADDSVPLFACPLYKGDPNKYWRANGCANWTGRTIDTVLRRHLGDTHVKVNGDIDNELYERLKNLKPNASTKDKQQEAEKHWKKIFRELFPTASQIPDPYFQAEHPNTAVLDAGVIERHLRIKDSQDPISARLGTVEFINRTKRLHHERDTRKERARAELVRKNAQNQQEFDDQIQEINEDYTARLSEVERQYMASLTSQVLRSPEAAGISPLPNAPTPQMSLGSVDDVTMFQQPGIGSHFTDDALLFEEEGEEASNLYSDDNAGPAFRWSR